ncbi:hypothetical protein PAXINDRAFT_18463 [Paxillus involutus ATCC 200175]|uniref:Transmembrane protein n=1 Tax=Paxillus involutus ATCC 200175 TaxID=664439 RepID=A0A0C9TM33_PAXIN|nr:hypothetical protein PAXINDRAFT_18463 [Paxillus involutus ATCC 200175]
MHAVLVVMLFGHPEHRVTVPADSTVLTVGLSASLQTFYTIYVALLVLITQRLAVSAALARQQKLTTIHDMCGAWSGIGAAINSLWQQTKVVASPSTTLVILTYLGCISGLHIISSSIIQFQPFNNPMTITIQSRLAWPPPSIDIGSFEWITIGSMLPMLPTLSSLSANGLTGSTLYDIPSLDYAFTGVVVNRTTVTTKCGLLPNTSAVTTTLDDVGNFNATVIGLGQISLPSEENDNMVIFLSSAFLDVHIAPGFSPSTRSGLKRDLPSCPLCDNYRFYSVSTAIQIGDLPSSDVVQYHTNGTFIAADGKEVSIPTTTYYIACSLNTTTTPYEIDMSSGQLTPPVPSSNDPLPGTVWSPGQGTELTAALNSAFTKVELFSTCQTVQLSGSVEQECGLVSIIDLYTMSLLGIDIKASTRTSDPGNVTPLITLERRDMENAISRVVAELIWLAGGIGTSEGGFQRIEVENLATQQVLQLRLNVNTIPVVVGLCASIILLSLALGMLRSQTETRLPTVTTAGVLELMWISAHSFSLRNHIHAVEDSSLDRLREEGMVDICLADIRPTISQDVMDSGRLGDETVTLSMSPEVPAVKLEESALKVQGHQGHDVSSSIGSATRWWRSYILHGILVALHVVFLVLLIRHPEHRVVIPLDTQAGVMAMGLSILLQAFYTLYTAGQVFITQRLALSRFIAQRRYLTAVHDVSSAWLGIGAAIDAVWQQRKVASSTWVTIAVMIYLGCVSVLHIASSTIMQFTAFNSTITTSVQSSMAWPNQSVDLTGLNWGAAVPDLPSMNMLSDLGTYGLSNNTLYDTLTTANALFVNATVNATSLQASCGLLSNLTYNESPDMSIPSYINFSVGGLGSGPFFSLQELPNQIVVVSPSTMSLFEAPDSPPYDPCPLCDRYLFFMLTTGVTVDGSINSTISVDAKYYTVDGNSSFLTIYLAACSLEAETVTATLDVQGAKLAPSPSQVQTDQQPWMLWSPGGSANLTNAMVSALDSVRFLDCPGFSQRICINMTTFGSPLFPPQSDPSALVMLSPYQLEQAIAQVAARMLWLAGQAGEDRGGFQRASGESQVTQVATQWRLNINKIPVLFASTASFVLFVIGLLLVGWPSRRRCTSMSGVSVLETLWIAAHSQALYERLADVDDASVDNLRAAGMFGICIADVKADHSKPSHQDSESDRSTLLE